MYRHGALCDGTFEGARRGEMCDPPMAMWSLAVTRRRPLGFGEQAGMSARVSRGLRRICVGAGEMYRHGVLCDGTFAGARRGEMCGPPMAIWSRRHGAGLLGFRCALTAV